jgi:hypothetical protein
MAYWLALQFYLYLHGSATPQEVTVRPKKKNDISKKKKNNETSSPRIDHTWRTLQPLPAVAAARWPCCCRRLELAFDRETPALLPRQSPPFVWSLQARPGRCTRNDHRLRKALARPASTQLTDLYMVFVSSSKLASMDCDVICSNYFLSVIYGIVLFMLANRLHSHGSLLMFQLVAQIFMDTCTSMKFRGIIVFAQLNISNKPKSHKLKRIRTTVSRSSPHRSFFPPKSIS